MSLTYNTDNSGAHMPYVICLPIYHTCLLYPLMIPIKHCCIKARLHIRTKYAISNGSSEIAFLSTVLVSLSTCIPYQLNIFPDLYAKTQSRKNSPRLRTYFVRIVYPGL